LEEAKEEAYADLEVSSL
jgi:hypothetical protein